MAGLAVELDRVSLVHRDGTRALDHVSCAVPAGQLCVVLGPSGAGKSTLLRCISGLALVTSGSVKLGGLPLDAQNLAQVRRRIGMIHQQFALVQRASVAANIMAGAATEMPWWRAMTGMYAPQWQARAIELLQSVGLEPVHLSRRTAALSGGQQQRVAIARAFIRRPELLIADEPVASLDPATAQTVLSLLRDHARARGTTVLCSLHQLDLAHAFADRVIALRAGRIVFDGPPSMLDQPEARMSGRRAPVSEAV